MTALDARPSVEIDFDSIAPTRPVALAPVTSIRATSKVAPRLQPALEARRLWERRYRRRLYWTDAVMVLVATTFAAALDAAIDPVHSLDSWTLLRVPALTALVWIVLLALFSTRATAILGSGATEYKRVAHATGLAFGIVAMTFVVFQWPGVRMQLLAALPLGLLALLAGRWAWRRWLVRQREFGHYTARAIVTGTRDDVEYVIRQLEQDPHHAYTIVGAATVDGSADDIIVDGRAYPVVGNTTTVAARTQRARRRLDHRGEPRPGGDPDFIKRLSWELEGTACRARPLEPPRRCRRPPHLARARRGAAR